MDFNLIKERNIFKLNPNYFNNMYTTVVIKVDEINRSLIIKK